VVVCMDPWLRPQHKHTCWDDAGWFQPDSHIVSHNQMYHLVPGDIRDVAREEEELHCNQVSVTWYCRLLLRLPLFS
jgi:hypothetical protein